MAILDFNLPTIEENIFVKDILDLNDILTGNNNPIIVEFYSDRCKHCNNFKETFESTAEDYSEELDFYRMNIKARGANIEQALSCNVKGLPSTVSFKADQIELGEVCTSTSGNQTLEKFEEWVKNAIQECGMPKPKPEPEPELIKKLDEENDRQYKHRSKRRH